jgi:hypothetical protein
MSFLKRGRRGAARFIAGLVFIAGALDAQEPRDVSLDATLGGGKGVGGGELRHRGGVALDALLGVRFNAAHSGAVMGGLSAGYQGYPISDDVCQFGSRGQCVDDFPGLSYVGVLAGWEAMTGTATSPGATVSMMAGPAFVYVRGHSRDQPPGRTAGAQGRVDAVAPLFGPLAFVASLRGTVASRYQGHTLAAWTLGFGLRVR